MKIDKNKTLAISGACVTLYGMIARYYGGIIEDWLLISNGVGVVSAGLCMILTAYCNNLRNRIKNLEERLDE